MGLFDDLINKASAPQDGGVSATSGSSQSSGGTGNPQSGGSQGGSTGQGSDPLAIVTPPIIETVNEGSIMTEAPVIPQPVLPDTPAVTTNTAQDGDELLIVSESAPTKEATVAEDADAPLVPITETSVVTPEPILEPSTQLVTENAVFSSLIGGDAHQEEMPPVVTESSKEIPLFEDPRSFVEASIEKIDTMIAHIDKVHESKLEEALGYKTEKERFSGLEATAYEDGERMMREKAHAEKMKAYFIEQRDASLDGLGTIETTLTTLAVQNSVDELSKMKKEKKSKEIESLIPVNT